MFMEVYLDNSATTFVNERVIELMNRTFTELYGNPSSLHRKGIEAEKLVKDARCKLAESLSVSPAEIIFTSGGTESNNLAIKGCARSYMRWGKHLITSKVEHPSVLNTCKHLEEEGFDVTYLDVDERGIVDVKDFIEAFKKDTILVSVMYINNEVGSIQPVQQISRTIASKERCFFHVDGVQAFGKLLINLKRDGIHMFSLSGHKINGPKGVGALYIKNGVKLKPLFGGGEQEKGLRSGTENVSGIAGLGKAVEVCIENMNAEIEHMRKLKIKLYRGIMAEIPDVKLNGPDPEDSKTSAPHILNLSFLGIKGEVLVHCLEEHGIYVSTGSACSSRKTIQSHVLKAMGLKQDELECAIRFSLSPYNKEEEIDYTISKLKKVVKELKQIMRR